MAWRKWIVRGVVFSILGGLTCAVGVYLGWTHPTVVREQVVERLQILFPGANINLDSARMRILGGISLSDLRLTRRDDPEQTELIYVPSAVLYHDKEQILDGMVGIRKVELQRPRLRLV